MVLFLDLQFYSINQHVCLCTNTMQFFITITLKYELLCKKISYISCMHSCKCSHQVDLYFTRFLSFPPYLEFSKMLISIQSTLSTPILSIYQLFHVYIQFTAIPEYLKDLHHLGASKDLPKYHQLGASLNQTNFVTLPRDQFSQNCGNCIP